MLEHPTKGERRAGNPAKGPWPAPVVERVEPVVEKYAQAWPAGDTARSTP
jgi:hypothetical protein